MRHRKQFIAVSISVVLVVVAAFCWEYVRDYRLGNFEGNAELYIYPGMTPDDVISDICKKTVIKRPDALERVFREKQVETYLKPGHYTVTPLTSSVALARMLNNGWQSPVNLVLSGTLRLRKEIARKISNQIMMKQDEVRDIFEDRALLAKFGFTPEAVFALIIPDTYNCYWTASQEDLLYIFKNAYDKYWSEKNIHKAKELGLTQIEVSILASIVCAESNYEPEMPKIAGVYVNRLRKGMRLQADPTVCFCFDYVPERVLKKHLEFDSPYNTYKYAGLPPGPICVPTKAALDAVLNADVAEGNIFFCANPDFSGTHLFTSSSAEHGRNARAFQSELNRRQRAKRAAAKKN